MTKIELTNKEVKEELLDMKRDVVADSWRDKALDVAIKALERVHTMSEEEFEAYLKDEDLVVVKRKYLKKALKVLGQISHLKDRPCEACEFYTGDGCSKWECVFEGSDAE